MQANAFNVSGHITSNLADERHESDVYIACLRFILSDVKINETKLMDMIRFYNQTMETRKASWKLKYLSMNRVRPSMRCVAMRVANRADGMSSIRSESTSMSHTGSLVVGATGMTFDQFCDLVRFPNSMSRLLRTRCYLLCSMEHVFDYRAHVDKLVTPDVGKALKITSVAIPDQKSVSAAINTITLHQAPFKELNEFRNRCFVSFSLHHKKALTLTMVLQLYIAAYQRREVWKAAWKDVYPVMSSQISHNVEQFVKDVPFPADTFVDILKNSMPFIG